MSEQTRRSSLRGVEARRASSTTPIPAKRMLVNIGPSHPAMHGVTRAVVELEGEIIRS